MQLSYLNNIPDSPYLDLLSPVKFNPIFIMGCPRSGTTFLYQTLVLTKCFDFVSAYHIIKYDELLYNHVKQIETQVRKELDLLFESLKITNRGIDNMSVGSNSPEEYGFVVSGYEFDLSSKNLPRLIELCQKVQFISQLKQPLLLKSTYFQALTLLSQTFPEARFIFIHRHPLAAINSSLKINRSLWSRKNAYVALISQDYQQILDNIWQRTFKWLSYSQYFELGLRRITKKYIEEVNFFLDNVESLPQQSYISVRYEDLCHQPETTIQNILKFLGLSAKVTLDYENLSEPRPLNLLPEVKKESDKMLKQLQSYLAYCGYDLS
jgi:hypothetical protein